jgi:hypothetical protein
MTPAEAYAAAEAEGLTLLRAENTSGFMGVSRSGSASKPFKAQLKVGGHHHYLGVFATAEEAALAAARFLGPEGVATPREADEAKARAPMTAEEAYAAAEAEGLTLLRAENSTGFYGVSPNTGRGKPFKAQLKQGGRNNNLGYFATAEEAALAVARFLGPEGVAAELAPEPAPMTAAEAHAAAAAEGLTLLRAENSTGFYGVHPSNSVSKTFKASLTRCCAAG